MYLRNYFDDPQVVAATARMSRAKFFVFVEGKSDFVFLENHLHRARVVPLSGKRKVLDVVSELDLLQLSNSVGLLDLDFDAALGKVSGRARRLIRVSLSGDIGDSQIDMEAALFGTRSMQKICVEYYGPSITEQGGADVVAAKVREGVRRATARVGAYRAAVQHLHYQGESVGKLGEIGPGCWRRFVDVVSLQVDDDKLQDFVLSRLGASGDRHGDIVRHAEVFWQELNQGWLLCRGHDLSRLFAAHLVEISGARVSAEDVERLLRVGFEREMLAQVAFGRELLIAQEKFSESHKKMSNDAGVPQGC